jgi:1-(5-phosphoribosyl)-5-[(5-phosphoribosylamino)methylideneamino] imidazole-4-carboxamide isomerase/N-(5'phosphoribosyl)anthranilate isomerase
LEAEMKRRVAEHEAEVARHIDDHKETLEEHTQRIQRENMEMVNKIKAEHDAEMKRLHDAEARVEELSRQLEQEREESAAMHSALELLNCQLKQEHHEKLSDYEQQMLKLEAERKQIEYDLAAHKDEISSHKEAIDKHLVDLDAAFGIGSNAELLAEVVGALDVKVELSGGIRDNDSLERALATGCARINLGTAALENPDWTAQVIAKHGEKIAVGLDVRGHTLAARGWTTEGGNLFETIERLDRDGCARYVLTDVAKDGTLMGPNINLLKEVAAATDRPIIASGGVSSLADLEALRELTAIGVEGAIVGKALYAGAFTLSEALAKVSQ